jgi:hypothetical protein
MSTLPTFVLAVWVIICSATGSGYWMSGTGSAQGLGTSVNSTTTTSQSHK